MDEFSVDIRAWSLLENKKWSTWGQLNFLIECKYNYPGVKWIFSPLDDEAVLTSGIINVYQDLTTKEFAEREFFYKTDNKIPYCYKGIELHAQDSNPQSIKRAFHQLTYASPVLASEIIFDQLDEIHDEDLHIGFIVPVIVTTAQLYVFKSGLDISSFKNAKDLDELADKTNILAISNSPSIGLRNFTNKLIQKLHTQYQAKFESRLKQINYFERKRRKKYLTNDWQIENSIRSSAETVLVTSYENFDKTIDEICRTLNKVGELIKQNSILKFDRTTFTSTIKSIKK